MVPVIDKQPQNVQHVIGKQENVQLEVGLEKNEEVKITWLKPIYQWYQSNRGGYHKGNVD